MNFFEKVKIAFRAFFKSYREPEKAVFYLGDSKPQKESHEQSHLRLLAILQQSSRLIDFLKEDISSFSDAQVGAAVRKIHEDCAKSLEEIVTIRPIMEENEGAQINVPAGYDPTALKVMGNVRGEPPFKGYLVHKGWKAHKRSLPKKIGDSTDVICPAEVEVR